MPGRVIINTPLIRGAQLHSWVCSALGCVTHTGSPVAIDTRLICTLLPGNERERDRLEKETGRLYQVSWLVCLSVLNCQLCRVSAGVWIVSDTHDDELMVKSTPVTTGERLIMLLSWTQLCLCSARLLQLTKTTKKHYLNIC